MTTASAATDSTDTKIHIAVRFKSVIKVATASGVYFSFFFLFATSFTPSAAFLPLYRMRDSFSLHARLRQIHDSSHETL